MIDFWEPTRIKAWLRRIPVHKKTFRKRAINTAYEKRVKTTDLRFQSLEKGNKPSLRKTRINKKSL